VMLKLPDSVQDIVSDTITRGSKNWVLSPYNGNLLVLDIPDIETVSFRCVSVKYPYYTERPVIYYGPVGKDTVYFWVPFKGHITSDASPWQKASIILWNGDEGYAGLYPIMHADSTIGSYKPKVLGFYRGEEFRNGFTLPTKVRIEFKFISKEGFDIRTTGEDVSPPRIVIDNSFTDILEVEILNDTLASSYYDFDFSSYPGEHIVGVSISSAKGIRGYSVWNLNFVSDSLRISDLMVYPNPYRGGKAYITFKLTKSARVKLKVYTPTGKIVETYNLGKLPPGFNSHRIDLSYLSNGIFVVLVEAESGKERVKDFTRIAVLR